MMRGFSDSLRVITKALVQLSLVAPASNRNTIASEIAVAALNVSNIPLRRH
jgi:hypothetical protein